MDSQFQESAYAKINLYLHVTGKRPDGYHLLDSMAIFAEAADRLILLPVSPQEGKISLEITGPFASELQRMDPQDNLIVRAANILAKKSRKDLPSAHILLEKNLPVASGIGGGSADAAATLRLLKRYWELPFTEQEMHDIALTLGADIPVCLQSQALRMEGIGEILTSFEHIPSFGMVLVNHGEAVSTQEVFAKREAAFSSRAQLDLKWSGFQSLARTISEQHNDLQEPACKIKPTIKKVLDEIQSLPDCRLARMSGSGATCFGLFDTPEIAKKMASILTSRNPNWWVWGGGHHNL